jgi:hypothetical protein
LKANRFQRDDEGVSVIVSAVLVLGLLVVIAATYTSTILPARIAQKEALHLQGVDESFGRIASALASDQHTSLRFSAVLPMGTKLESMFVPTGSKADLFVYQSEFFQRVTCENPKLLTLGQAPAPGATFAGGPLTRTNVGSIELMRMKLTNYVFPNGKDTMTVEASRNAKTMGRFQAIMDGKDNSIRVVVSDADGRLSVDQLVETGLPEPLPGFLIDVMDPLYGFSGLVAGLPQPWTLKFTSTSGSGGLFALYRQPSGAASLIGVGSSIASPWIETSSSDALVFDAKPTTFTHQTYALEGGAFILQQPAGAVLRSGSVAAADGANRWLSLTGLSLDGSGSRSGSDTVQVEFNREPVGRKIVECDNPRWNATTHYPEAWAAGWHRVAGSSGVPVSIQTGTDSAVAELKGRWFVEWSEGHVQSVFQP